jgi:hypothetical protein
MPSPAAAPTSSKRLLCWALAGVLALLALFQLATLVQSQRQHRHDLVDKGRSEAERFAQTLDSSLRVLEPVARALAADLEGGRLDPAHLPARLNQDLERNPGIARLDVALPPGCVPGTTRPAAPYAARLANGIRSGRLEDARDATREEWFWEAMAGDGWGEPHQAGPGEEPAAGYCLRFRLPEGKTDGVVRLQPAMDRLRQVLAGPLLPNTLYASLVSAKGVFLVHPRKAWVDDRWTTFRVAEEQQDAVPWRAGEWALRGEPGDGVGTSYSGRFPVRLFVAPVATARWSVQVVRFYDTTRQDPVGLRRHLTGLACTLLALAACLALARAGRGPVTFQVLWRCQLWISILLALGTGIIWALTLALPNPAGRMARPVLSEDIRENLPGGKESRRWRVPTGILVETLNVENAGEIAASGRIWQRYPPDFPQTEARGFFFPDAQSEEIQETRRRPEASGELREFTFRTRIRQEFGEAYKYPFDTAVVRLRILPRMFIDQVALVPDFPSYFILNPASLPGLGKDLTVSGWKVARSYFTLPSADYNTSFGTPWSSADQAPELSFQVEISREFLTPFISALLPVIVVAGLLYALLLAFEAPPDGEATSSLQAGTDVIGGTSTLLLPVLYAQISLREKFAAAGLMYLEYFYFVIYLVILLVAVHALTVTSKRAFRIAGQAEYRVARLVFWPGILGTLFLLSCLFLY